MTRYLILTILTCLIASCADKGAQSDTPAVPRRHAYPRIEVPDSTFSYVTDHITGLSVAVNNGATHSQRNAENSRAPFIDVTYPGLNSQIYFTITPVDSISVEEVLANRLERISLNLGGAEAELIEFDSPAGFENKVIATRGDIATPVQFIATDGTSAVVSGAAFIKDASPATADSIAPLVNMLRRDIIHALKTLRR